MKKWHKIELEDGRVLKLCYNDLVNFFYSSRGFPSILAIGSGKYRVMGEGQSGGRFITDVARALEMKIVQDIGRDKYLSMMHASMGR
jgi:hypothetical protein